MNTPVSTLIEQRISTNKYDPARQLLDTEITELVRLATLAPTAFNLQNWKFIAVRTPEAKSRLKSVAYEQQKVVDAAVTFIVCGVLAAHEGLDHALRPSLKAGILDQATFDGWLGAARKSYAGNPQFQRDEAIRSAALGAMTLMLAAQGRGLASGPMIGFDADGVSRVFSLAATEIPAILVTVGYAAPGNWPQKPRRPISEVLAYV